MKSSTISYKNNLSIHLFSSFLHVAMTMDSRISYYYLFLLFSYYFYDIKYFVVLCHKQNEHSTSSFFCKAIKSTIILHFNHVFFLIELKNNNSTINMTKNFPFYFLFADDFDIFFFFF